MRITIKYHPATKKRVVGVCIHADSFEEERICDFLLAALTSGEMQMTYTQPDGAERKITCNFDPLVDG